MTEVAAVKAEITDVLTRRFKGDSRDPSDVFGIASTAVAEILAELLFAAAQDRDHGMGLLTIVNACILSRWQSLATRHAERS